MSRSATLTNNQTDELADVATTDVIQQSSVKQSLGFSLFCGCSKCLISTVFYVLKTQVIQLLRPFSKTTGKIWPFG